MTSGRSLPWSDGDILGICGSTAIGLVAIVAAWYGVSGTAAIASQAGWLNLAVGGTVLSAVGNSIWLLRGRRAVGERRTELVTIGPAPADPAPHPHDPTAPAPTLVRVDGMHRIHRADCPLVQGKPVVPARSDGTAPCGVCLP